MSPKAGAFASFPRGGGSAVKIARCSSGVESAAGLTPSVFCITVIPVGGVEADTTPNDA